ncbi:MFS transporter [Beijerinckia sp. L45]|uniref:MFS transporter n=1 Tax=Beijerinckia sp. L45 TaxID=1641855 RepID=UPI00131B73E9|nr:MFS transporter [Beijerinckia sp. L45]
MNRALLGAIVMATIAGCGLSLTVALLSVRLDVAGYSAHAIGLNTAAAGIASLLGAPFVPRVAKRVGIARLLMISLAIGGLTLLGFTLTQDYGVWLILRFIMGMAVTVLFVLSEFWITTASTSDRRGLAIGLYATSLGAGFALGPVLLAAVGTSGNLPFFIGTALFWGAIVPLVANTPSAPLLETRSRKPFWMFLKEAPVATLAGLLHGAIEVAGIGLLPVYALRAGASAEQGALFASIFVLGAGAMQVPLGLLSDRLDRRKLLLVIAGLGLVGALFLAVVGLSSLILFEVVLLLWGGTVGGLYPVGLAHLGARYRDGELAGANAAFVMTYSLGMLIGPPLIGAGLDLVPPSGFFLGIAILIGLYLAVAGLRLTRSAASVTAG